MLQGHLVNFRKHLPFSELQIRFESAHCAIELAHFSASEGVDKILVFLPSGRGMMTLTDPVMLSFISAER